LGSQVGGLLGERQTHADETFRVILQHFCLQTKSQLLSLGRRRPGGRPALLQRGLLQQMVVTHLPEDGQPLRREGERSLGLGLERSRYREGQTSCPRESPAWSVSEALRATQPLPDGCKHHRALKGRNGVTSTRNLHIEESYLDSFHGNHSQQNLGRD